MHEYSLSLICQDSVVERLTDLLLQSDAAFFTSAFAHYHGTTDARSSAQDQVTGRSRATHIQVLAGEDELSFLLEKIQKSLPDAGIRYWATRVAYQGEFK